MVIVCRIRVENLDDSLSDRFPSIFGAAWPWHAVADEIMRPFRPSFGVLVKCGGIKVELTRAYFWVLALTLLGLFVLL